MMQKYGKTLINLNNPVILTFDNGLSPALIRCYHAVSIKVNIVPTVRQIIDAYSNNCVFVCQNRQLCEQYLPYIPFRSEVGVIFLKRQLCFKCRDNHRNKAFIIRFWGLLGKIYGVFCPFGDYKCMMQSLCWCCILLYISLLDKWLLVEYSNSSYSSYFFEGIPFSHIIYN